jgi:hypothetical protein
MISALFLVSGIGKITAPAATIAYIPSFGLPFPQLGLAVGIAGPGFSSARAAAQVPFKPLQLKRSHSAPKCDRNPQA